jgi:hypothetical protein
VAGESVPEELKLPRFRRRSKADAGLRLLFKSHLPMFDWAPIESGITARGIPDVNYCCAGIEGWMEFKSTNHWTVPIRPEQIGWIERRLDHGGAVFLAVRRARHELILFQGHAARHLASRRIDEVDCIGWWHKGPANWDWGKIQWLLLRKKTLPSFLST